ncbi:MAG: hypothetical protein AAF004_07515 [Pseudomonadota bacterium]
MKPQIRLVRDRHEAKACRQFWYDVYVTEMGRHRDDASAVDHERGELSDRFQPKADLFAAWDGNLILGTVQSVYAAHSDFGEYLHLYQLANRSASELKHVTLTNKLMVASTVRSSGLAFHLACTTYRKGLADGILENYIDCNEHLIRFYERLGYREHLGWIEHAKYGRVYSMVLQLTDHDHLEQCKSPLRRHLAAFTQSQTTGATLNEQVA